jgi:hypothetical protein
MSADAFIPQKDRPPQYDPDKKVSEYKITELASFFEHLYFEVKGLTKDKISGPFFISIKPLDGIHDGAVNDFTLQNLLDALKRLELTIIFDAENSCGGIGVEPFWGHKFG